MERKYLKSFLETPVDEGDGKRPGSPTGSTKEDAFAIRQWLAEHRSAKPIAGAISKRTRFTGLHNNSAGGIWASLDKDVCLTENLFKDLGGDDWTSAARSEPAKRFPHAILEIRREGNQAISLIQTLDRSHLVRRTLVLFTCHLLTNTGRACPRVFFGSTCCVDVLQAECNVCSFLDLLVGERHSKATGACPKTQSESQRKHKRFCASTFSPSHFHFQHLIRRPV